MLRRIKGLWKAFLAKGAYPDDPRERQRIKAHILGAGTSEARSGAVEVEDEGKK